MNIKPDVLIVGAGVAGITCALRCQEMGMNFLIIEKNDRVGGRLGSVYEDGYTFDTVSYTHLTLPTSPKV